MASIVKILRVAADPNRLRILMLLRAEELSVAELQEILAMGQSTISTHLAQLKQAGLVEDRRTGKSNLYRLAPQETVAATTAVPPNGEDNIRSGQNRSGQNPPKGENENSSGSNGCGHNPPEGDAKIAQGNPERTRRGSPGKTADETTAPRRGAAKTAPILPASPELELPRPVLKGHDFSRAMEPQKSSGALAPEGRSFLDDLLTRAAAEIPEAPDDLAAMRRVLRKRQDKTRAFFDSVAGRLGRDYVPGKSWKSTAEALLRVMPPMTIADLGAGEGAFALLLAQRAKKVIAVDSSSRMIDVGREQAARNGIANVDFRLGDMEELPIGSSEVELVFFSQSLHHALHPARALEEAWRILAPGGRIAVLDLARHRFEEARELYADEWLGFSEAELEAMLEKARFIEVTASIVDKEPETPQFQTLLAVGTKPV
jgi:ubiquinone/menaquinone biosynthesis C-methylase UbiE/DNA-binding transcriptional ArsR family regulator